MEKNSLLILSLVALTAIVTMTTKTIELMSALLQYKKEKDSPTSTTPASLTIQQTRRRARLIWDAFVIVISLAGIFWFMFGPFRSQPVTIRDIAFIGICIVNLLNSGGNR